MVIKKILNHNIVIALNSNNHECVLTGKGIAFGKRNGDTIDEKLVERVFTTKEKGVAEKLSLIIGSIPLKYIRVGDEIINMAKRELNGRLNEKIYLTLIDHIYFAIERHCEGVDLTNSLKWEMKNFYPVEFAIGIKALAIIDNRLGISLPDDEAAYIAFHLVNAGTQGSKCVPVQDSLKMIKGILKIVSEEFNVKLDRTDISYDRFMRHLQNLSLRILMSDMTGHKSKQEKEDPLYLFSSKCTKERNCVNKVSKYIEDNFKYCMNEEEKVFLIIHLHSLLRNMASEGKIESMASM